MLTLTPSMTVAGATTGDVANRQLATDGVHRRARAPAVQIPGRCRGATPITAIGAILASVCTRAIESLRNRELKHISTTSSSQE
jgi:hypothetical protein